MKKTEEIYNELVYECQTLCKGFKSNDIDIEFDLCSIENTDMLVFKSWKRDKIYFSDIPEIKDDITLIKLLNFMFKNNCFEIVEINNIVDTSINEYLK